MSWDVDEAIALARALGWRVVGSGAEEEDSSDESGTDSDEAEAEDREERSARDRSVVVSDRHICRIDRVDPRLFFPIGDLSRVAVDAANDRADVLFVNTALSPTQQRSLEAAMDLAASARRSSARRPRTESAAAASGGIAVFDRSHVILAIFARRAATPLARLRVELAEASASKARLGAAAVRGTSAQLQRVADALARRVKGCDRAALDAWSGAAGGVATSFNSSPQKTKQKMQKTVDDRERRIREEIARVHTHAEARRLRRGRLQTIALVGYTNVGKSAVVNALASSDLQVKDGVFVTLDIAARRVSLPSGGECYILDSVGFVRNLPLELCDSFLATIDELSQADVVLHVRDMSHPSRDEHATIIGEVLERAGIDTERRMVEVWNKVDLLSPRELRHFQYVRGKNEGVSVPLCLVSALHGDGIEELRAAIDRRLSDVRGLPHARGLGAETAIKAER